MDTQNDSIISQITVRLKNKDNTVIGTGVIYYDDSLEDIVYILTASHCLFEDGDRFTQQYESITIDIYNVQTSTYNSIINKSTDSSLLYKDENKDVALLIFQKDEILRMIGLNNIPSICVVQERHSFSKFVTKGFPRATKGKELETLPLQHPRKMTEVNKFQLETPSSYSESNIEGFSGSGVFLLADNKVYLYGIFTRYRKDPDEKGRVVYCQYIELLNDILRNKFLPTIPYTYIGENGLTKEFFQSHVEKSIHSLGGRFNQKLNFRLPIAQKFNALSYNTLFKNKFIKAWDEWLTERPRSYNLEGNIIKEIKEQFNSLKKAKLKWLSELKFDYRQELAIRESKGEIQELNERIRNKLDELSELESKGRSDSRKYQNEKSWLIDILRHNSTLFEELDNLDIELINNPILIINGDAGSGKSHLLGDIANERIKNNLPTLLLLGQHFQSSKTIEENILNLLHLDCSFIDLLINLDKISSQIGSRVLILIDAINEGAGSDLWNSQIAGFISIIRKYKGVGIAISIRSTYFDDIITNDFIDTESPQIIEHEGFKGNEYEALKLFCEYYSLKLPSFPILAPEFSNPLFLHLICNTVKELPNKTFPKGFNGLNGLYQLYINSLNKRFEIKNKKYKLKNIVSASIEVLSTAILDSKYGYLSVQEAVNLFDEKFSKFDTLLIELIEENILIRNKIQGVEGEFKEVIYFAYQRLGDYFMAKRLLGDCSSKEDVLKALKDPNGLGRICSDFQWKYRGVIDALSIILPEEYNLDIFEISEYFITNEERRNKSWESHINDWISGVELDSLKWRKVESINDEKIINWLQSGKALIANNEWFLCLTELSSIINHPFNSDRLTRILKRYPMAKRDSFWQEFILYYNGYNDDNIAFPIQRLIDWAWMPDISTLSDDETAKLVSQTLVWILSTTNTKLRDQTTKALVNLLEQKPNILLELLEIFQDIDDFYILERLYAVAYGCVLRTEDDKSIKIIAEYVYNSIFKEGNPPKHILLRDYAKNIVEYAIYKDLVRETDTQQIRPPYNSEIPEFPTEEDIKKLEIEFEDNPNYKSDYSNQHNAIIHSLTGFIGDFGEKVVKPRVQDFYHTPFEKEKEYEGFIKKLKKDKRELVKLLFECMKSISFYENEIETYTRINLPKEKMENSLSRMKEVLKFCDDSVLQDFNNEECQYTKDILIPYFERKIKSDDNLQYSDSMPIRYWIVQRVFELGYDKEIHGKYDWWVKESGYRREFKIERIGKKYQWIAFYEIFAILSDNYKYKDNRWGSDKYDYFKGAWQTYLRDIDPATTTIRKENDDVEDIPFLNSLSNEWWEDKEYANWAGDDSQWVLTLEDLVHPHKIIRKIDDTGSYWLHLHHYVRWIEPKKIGEERYGGQKKQVWYMFNAYLVKKKDKQKIVNYLSKKNFWGRWMPEANENFSSLINREKFWSPAYKDESRESGRKLWYNIGKSSYKVIVADTQANGNMEDDKSGTSALYKIPCRFIFEGMELQYAPKDGDLKNKDGEIIVTNINPNGVMIRENDLLEFLDKNDLDIIWTLLGEKFSHSTNREDESYFRVPCGVFYLEEGKMKGEMVMYDRD